MFKSYIKIAWRILLSQKIFSFINIFGLMIGLTACLLIIQYVSFELSFDDFHKNQDRIFRIKHQNYSQGNLIENLPKTYSAVGRALKSDLPEVKVMTRVSKLEGLVTVQQRNGALIAFNEHNIYSADASFLRLFSFPMISGTVDALKNPNTIVITQKIAEKYFHNQNPIGEIIKIQQQESGTNIIATITGVCKDVPANSHLQFDFLISADLKDVNWVYPDYYTYILLSKDTDLNKFGQKLNVFVKNYTGSGVGSTNSSPTMGKSNLANISLSLQPLRDIHLYSNLTQEISVGGNGTLVWDLVIIAALILIIAYINYVNLSTAKVIERAKEVGIRKVLGSQRSQLIIQFLFESLLINLISIAGAILLVFVSMPWFSKLCSTDMSFNLLSNHYILLAFIGFLIIGILASAIYPALILSNYKPIQILKGKFHHTSQSLVLRKALVVFQFIATICFITGTLIVYSQVNFMKTADKGMDVDQTLIVIAPQNIRANDQDAMKFASNDSLFQVEVLRNPQIQGITSSSSIPGKYIEYVMSYKLRSQSAGEKSLRLPTFEIGYNFIDQFKTKVIAGEKFSLNLHPNKSPMMLNEAAVVSLGFKSPNDAIGRIIETQNSRGRVFENEVVGVIKNFHQTSLKDAFTPTVFRLIDPSSVKYYELKIKGDNLSNAIAQIEKTYKATFTDSAFEYFFLDDFFNQQYNVEQSFGKIFSLFAGFAIFIAGLGLYGLTLITVTQRVKEIGVRKVLGASAKSILFLISKDFIYLIALANIIALPLSYWISYKWLENYQFRIHYNIWFFLIPMLTVFFIALITISFHVLKVASSNPVKSLRTE